MQPLFAALRRLSAAALVGFGCLATPTVAQDTVCNSFTGDTLVHVRPQGANAIDALKGKTEKRAIKDLQPGDEVLAYAEWKDKGTSLTDDGQRLDERLSYQKVQEVMITQDRVRTLVHLSLSDGQKITTTDGHPFKTLDGWRDAILLKKGGKLLLKGGEGDSDHLATIDEVRTEQITVKTFNLEVANAHTFFVGDEGVLVHNASVGGNRGAGKQFERDVANAINSQGTNKATLGGPGIRTPFGWRFPDIRVTDKAGSLVGFVECKKGNSRYTNSQRTKDDWIRRNMGVDTTLIRG